MSPSAAKRQPAGPDRKGAARTGGTAGGRTRGARRHLPGQGPQPGNGTHGSQGTHGPRRPRRTSLRRTQHRRDGYRQSVARGVRFGRGVSRRRDPAHAGHPAAAGRHPGPPDLRGRAGGPGSHRRPGRLDRRRLESQGSGPGGDRRRRWRWWQRSRSATCSARAASSSSRPPGKCRAVPGRAVPGRRRATTIGPVSPVPDVPIPPDLSRRYGHTPAGRAWLASLPGLIGQCLDRGSFCPTWNLAPCPGTATAASSSPCGAGPGAGLTATAPHAAVLKVAFPHDEATKERHALALWGATAPSGCWMPTPDPAPCSWSVSSPTVPSRMSRWKRLCRSGAAWSASSAWCPTTGRSGRKSTMSRPGPNSGAMNCPRRGNNWPAVSPVAARGGA